MGDQFMLKIARAKISKEMNEDELIEDEFIL